MKDLKENIQKNNMKKLVLSAVLGMFCYCTNNAMNNELEEKQKENIESPENIGNDILLLLLVEQATILNAKSKIKDEEKKNINTTIKNKQGKIIKKDLIDFIDQQLGVYAEANEKKKEIEIIEHYFNIDEINEGDECAEDKFTEVFWTKEEGGSAIEEKVNEIYNYLTTIIKFEKMMSSYIYFLIEKRYQEHIKNEKDAILQDNMDAQMDAQNKKIRDGIMQKIAKEILGENDNAIATTFEKNLLKILKRIIEFDENKEKMSNENSKDILRKAKNILQKEENKKNIVDTLKKRILKNEQNQNRQVFIDFLNYLYAYGIHLKTSEIFKKNPKVLEDHKKKDCPCCC